MIEQPPPPGISVEDWTATPAAVRGVVLALLREVAELQERVSRTSRNSSKPPSSDPPNAAPRSKRSPSGRKRGGQKGRKGHGRRLKAPEEVTRVVVVRPDCCAECGALLLGEDPQPVCHQITELPPVKPEVIEYQQHTITCLACGAQNRGEWPAEMPTGAFGPRVQATVGYLAGRGGMSQREVQEVMGTVLHTEMGLGTVSALEQQVSEALAEPVEEAQFYLREQTANNVDETSWREGTQRTWLWIDTTPEVTVFWILPGRGAEQAKQVLGETFGGIVGSDRYAAYNWLEPQRRAVCWAHLERDFQAFVDRGGESQRVGQALLEQSGQMFGLWHQVKDGSLNRVDFQTHMEPIRITVGELLREGTEVAHDKTCRTCQNILKLEQALWTFVDVEGVEPTNNDAERPLRRAVLWRRRSFGTQSETGSRFVERVLTAVTTLRQQERDVLDYLTEACAAATSGETSPSLLPLLPPVNAVA
jgi:transposase